MTWEIVFYNTGTGILIITLNEMLGRKQFFTEEYDGTE